MSGSTSINTDSTSATGPSSPVLVVGGTGRLGGRVIDELLARGKSVRALVRDATDPSALHAKGIEIARGDMLDLESLTSAMTGTDAVISTAAGYTRRSPQADEIDTTGNMNLAEAAAATGVRRFVLTSILTSDQTPQVPHFWHKKLTEDRLDELHVPFVALRPGAFLDQVVTMNGDPFDAGRLMWLGSTTVPLTFVVTPDLARCLAEAVDADVESGERIDIGWDRPVSMSDIAGIASRLLGTTIAAATIPTPFQGDMGAMVDWFGTGRYVADTSRQAQVFGPVPTAEDAVSRFVRSLGHPVVASS
jgi:uncharacterized protein YbjT (DUF2867 family)